MRRAPIPEVANVVPSTSFNTIWELAATVTDRVAVGAVRAVELLAKKSSVTLEEAGERLTRRSSSTKFSPFAPVTLATTGAKRIGLAMISLMREVATPVTVPVEHPLTKGALNGMMIPPVKFDPPRWMWAAVGG